MGIKLSPKKIVYCCFGLAVTGIISSYVAGPPPATTCAPGETTCSTNGLCHAGPANKGPGVAEITMMSLPTNGYTPGQTYSMMPYLVPQDTNMKKAGFEAVALLQSNRNLAGSVIITDPTRTQYVSYNSKQYVEQTATGAISTGIHDWMYDWTAPPAGSGTVIFYASFVAGNGDGTSSGDFIYTDTLVLPENTLGIDEYASDKNLIHSVFPIPASSFLNIEFSNSKYQHISLTIYSINGKIVFNDKISLTNQHFIYSTSVSDLSSGVYFISVKSDDNSEQTLSLKRFVKL